MRPKRSHTSEKEESDALVKALSELQKMVHTLNTAVLQLQNSIETRAAENKDNKLPSAPQTGVKQLETSTEESESVEVFPPKVVH